MKEIEKLKELINISPFAGGCLIYDNDKFFYYYHLVAKNKQDIENAKKVMPGIMDSCTELMKPTKLPNKLDFINEYAIIDITNETITTNSKFALTIAALTLYTAVREYSSAWELNEITKGE